MIYPFDEVRRFSNATSYYLYIIRKTKFPQIRETFFKTGNTDKKLSHQNENVLCKLEKLKFFLQNVAFSRNLCYPYEFLLYIKRSHIIMPVALKCDFSLYNLSLYFSNNTFSSAISCSSGKSRLSTSSVFTSSAFSSSLFPISINGVFACFCTSSSEICV